MYLDDWTIYLHLKDLGEEKKMQFYADSFAREVHIYVDRKSTPKKSHLVHEFVHLLLFDLRELIISRLPKQISEATFSSIKLIEEIAVIRLTKLILSDKVRNFVGRDR